MPGDYMNPNQPTPQSYSGYAVDPASVELSTVTYDWKRGACEVTFEDMSWNVPRLTWGQRLLIWLGLREDPAVRRRRVDALIAKHMEQMNAAVERDIITGAFDGQG